MAKKLANLLQELIKRAGADVDTSSFQSLEDEITTEQYEAVLGKLYTLETATSVLKPTISGAVKAEALNGVDAQILEILGEVLSEEEREAVAAEKNTAPKMRKVVEFFKSKAVKPANEPDTVKALTKALEEAKAEIRAKDSGHAEKLAEVEAKHKSELFERDLSAKISARTDIAADKKEGRHFTPNFVTDLNDLLAKEKIKIDHDTLKILKEDGTPYFSSTAHEVTVDDLIGRVVKEYNYEKKSVTPERVTIEADRNQGGGQFANVSDRMADATKQIY